MITVSEEWQKSEGMHFGSFDTLVYTNTVGYGMVTLNTSPMPGRH